MIISCDGCGDPIEIDEANRVETRVGDVLYYCDDCYFGNDDYSGKEDDE
jgi:hypothetical protein